MSVENILAQEMFKNIIARQYYQPSQLWRRASYEMRYTNAVE